MNVILLSEHYDPIVGGTTTYVKKICKGLLEHTSDVSITLVHPAIEDKETVENDRFTIKAIGIGVNIASNFVRNVRYQFCELANDFLKSEAGKQKIEVVHILFGLFLTEKLDVSFLRSKQIKVFNTIHNVPPEECSVSWKEDSKSHYYKDQLRKKLVGRINRKRILKEKYDKLIVPSSTVKTILSNVVSANQIDVIGHGIEAPSFIARQPILPDSELRLLTVGGLVPHKNQHLIPQIAALLKGKVKNMSWDIVGPERNKRYVGFIRKEIEKHNVDNEVRLNISITYEQLVELYKKSNLYVQLSREEGFCFTALDAILYSLPIIGTPTGAIPEIVESGKGLLVECKTESIVMAILQILEAGEYYQYTEELHNHLKQTYSWEHSIKKLLKTYRE